MGTFILLDQTMTRGVQIGNSVLYARSQYHISLSSAAISSLLQHISQS